MNQMFGCTIFQVVLDLVLLDDFDICDRNWHNIEQPRDHRK